VEAIDVEGAERTRPAVVLDTVGLRPRRLLTPYAFARAARRLDELPAASRTELTQRPAPHGSVRVKASIEERALMPTGFGAVGRMGRGLARTVSPRALVKPRAFVKRLCLS
jgi:hypothetical protein